MKKRNLLLGVVLLAGYSAQAVSSPYEGSVAVEGVYYLYQVETGQWLESNKKFINTWTTHAEIDDTGIDIELKKPDGFAGYQIWMNYTQNGSLNGANRARFYFDTNRELTDWIFEPVTVEGVSNAYKIMAKAKTEGVSDDNKITADFYIGADANGVFSDAPTQTTWQLVSREERMRVVKEQVKAGNGPVDVSWLLPWWQIDRNNLRDRQWVKNTVNAYGGGDGFNGKEGYPVKEFWHMITTRYSYTFEDLPAGTYGFSVQGYYRDTAAPDNDDNREAGEALVQRYLNGTEVLRAKYFAGAERGTIMSIFQDAKTESADGYTLEIPAAGKWLPNSMNDASFAMINGAYKNDYLEVGVADGKLTVGFEKNEADWHDWLIIGRFYLTYIGEEVKGEDLTGLQKDLSDLIATANALPQTPFLINAIEEANSRLADAQTSNDLLAAIDALQSAVTVINQSKDPIRHYIATKALAEDEGIDISGADELFNSAVSRDNYDNALTQLRRMRMRALRETHEDVFTGCAPVDGGEYYIYNLGMKQFLTGGSSWGAHAALGFPGNLCTFEIDAATNNSFYINTHLNNGGTSEYLNYRGYMDAGRGDDFYFEPVPGKENVYYIKQNDYRDVHMAYNPDASVNDGQKDETTVGTECRNLDPENLDAQWKLVTKAERDALIEKASIDNPVDVSYLISNPNFCQRASIDSWAMTNAVVWERGKNHGDFCLEAWNKPDASISQNVEGLPAGVYSVSVNGLFRNGHHRNEGEVPGQPDNEQISHAVLKAGAGINEETVSLPNIIAESGKAPGECPEVTASDGTVYSYPEYCDQATKFFRMGFYKVNAVVEHDGTQAMPIGVEQTASDYEKSWTLCDNFRIKYYGNNTTKEEVEERLQTGVEAVVSDSAAKADNRIFNLQGIQVVNPTQPGIYIQNGKKFIVR